MDRTARRLPGIDWFVRRWPEVGLYLAAVLLALLVVLLHHLSVPLLIAYLLLPAYMIHQHEEHGHDRFARFVDDRFHVHGLFTPAALAWFNVVGVWIVLLAAFELALHVDPAYALVGVFLVAINALVHIIAAIALRRSNPGLVSAIVLFVPLAALGLSATARLASLAQLVLAFGIALLLHVMILVYAGARLRLLRTPR